MKRNLFFFWDMVSRFFGAFCYRPLRYFDHLSSSPAFFSTSRPCKAKKRMPPKKAGAPEKKILLGRPSNNLKIGIVGLFLFTKPISSSMMHLGVLRSSQRRKIFFFQCPVRNRSVISANRAIFFSHRHRPG